MTQQEKLEQLLTEHGFVFEIGGCGCCGSPWVKVAYKGEVIFDQDDVSLKMFTEPEAK